MVGLGEEWDEVVATLRDLRAAGCQIVTIGQYLRPSLANLPMARYYTPAEFAELKRIGARAGLRPRRVRSARAQLLPRARADRSRYERAARRVAPVRLDAASRRQSALAVIRDTSSPARAARACAPTARASRARRKPRIAHDDLLGQARCPGFGDPQRARAGARPGAGGARRQPHRPRVHRRRARAIS